MWSPYKDSETSCVEKVQRSFTKHLPGLKNFTYRDRLSATNLETLELQQLRADLVMCYKIVFSLTKVAFCKFFRFAPTNNTCGHCYKLLAEQSSHNVRYHFFPRVWLIHGTVCLLILTFPHDMQGLKQACNGSICLSSVLIRMVVSAPLEPFCPGLSFSVFLFSVHLFMCSFFNVSA